MSDDVSCVDASRCQLCGCQQMSSDVSCVDVSRYQLCECHQMSAAGSDCTDARLAQELHAKLGYTRGLRYTDIATAAADLGRHKLAVTVC